MFDGKDFLEHPKYGVLFSYPGVLKIIASYRKDLENKFKDSFKSKNTVASTRRETGRTEVAKGGRINFKGGGCAIKGKGKAYGKNS